ncbi:MAG: DegT/DnrJ/EryC1/StrS family aminotransferase [Candidatus Omnitrophica bacterium]|nr:DegT/DnrJ/EryC1/StrS family aminotransferase [Candidatus Omnitrophota bacterium]
MKEYMIPWWKTDLGEKETKKIGQSILAGHITQGPVTQKLEGCLAEILDVPYAVLTINGSSALLMSLLACGIKPGDEIIIPNLTFVATALAPRLLGAKIKLVDVEYLRPLIDVEQVKKSITGKTKAIIPVHLNGRAADIRAINKLGRRHGITVIEDAAQALCSRNSSGCLGTQSEMGIFSLAITKLITTVQGGLVVTRSKKLFDKLRAIRDYGITKKDGLLLKQGITGFNFKFNDILASIGLSQIKRVREKIKTIRDNYILYQNGLKGLDYINLIDVRVEEGELPLWVEALCVQRDKLIQLLKRKGILAKPYELPICELLPGAQGKRYKRSELYAGSGLILPSGPDQSKDDLLYVIETLKEIKRII